MTESAPWPPGGLPSLPRVTECPGESRGAWGERWAGRLGSHLASSWGGTLGPVPNLDTTSDVTIPFRREALPGPCRASPPSPTRIPDGNGRCTPSHPPEKSSTFPSPPQPGEVALSCLQGCLHSSPVTWLEIPREDRPPRGQGLRAPPCPAGGGVGARKEGGRVLGPSSPKSPTSPKSQV